MNIKEEWLNEAESIDKKNPAKKGKKYKPVKHNSSQFIGKSYKGRGGRSK